MKVNMEKIKKLKPLEYVDYKIRNVTKIKNKYGFRIVLYLVDNTEKVIQHSGFSKKSDAEKERCKIIGQLENKTYIVYNNLNVETYFSYWFKYEAIKRLKSYNSFLSYRNVVFNYIIPKIGKVQLKKLSNIIIKRLYNEVYREHKSIAKVLKTVMISALDDAKKYNFVANNEAIGIKLPKDREDIIKEKTEKIESKYHTLVIDERKTYTIKELAVLIEKSKNTPIHLQILFASLMGLRKSEINGLKYSDIDYIHRTIKIQRQLGRKIKDLKDNYKAKELTKQEVRLKTESSYRTLDIPDIVFEAIMDNRKLYEKQRKRRINDKTNPFKDLDYICCSSYGKPRSRDFIYNHYKKLIEENNLPKLPFHKLRTTYTTILAKNDFSIKAIAILLGHHSEIVTFENYTDKNEIIYDCLVDIEPFIESVIPKEKLNEKIIEVETDEIMQSEFEELIA